jgi:hypothetical protein
MLVMLPTIPGNPPLSHKNYALSRNLSDCAGWWRDWLMSIRVLMLAMTWSVWLRAWMEKIIERRAWRDTMITDLSDHEDVEL